MEEEEFYLRDAKKGSKKRGKKKEKKMKKREEEVKEFVSWERKREFWFRIEFGVKRRPPPSGTCQPFRIAQHPFYSTNSSRAIFTYAPLIHLHGERFTNAGVEHFSNESRDRVLEEDPRWIYIFDIVDRTLYLPFLLFIFFFTVGVHCCINIGISSNASRYDSIKNHEGISVSCSTSVDTFHFVSLFDRLTIVEDKRNIF